MPRTIIIRDDLDVDLANRLSMVGPSGPILDVEASVDALKALIQREWPDDTIEYRPACDMPSRDWLTVDPDADYDDVGASISDMIEGDDYWKGVECVDGTRVRVTRGPMVGEYIWHNVDHDGESGAILTAGQDDDEGTLEVDWRGRVTLYGDRLGAGNITVTDIVSLPA